jgi:hypothetical protein
MTNNIFDKINNDILKIQNKNKPKFINNSIILIIIIIIIIFIILNNKKKEDKIFY